MIRTQQSQEAAATTEDEIGIPRQITEEIWLISLPISSRLKYVNAYLIEDEAGWSLLDCGVASPQTMSIFGKILQTSPFVDKPLKRVIATHFHPDHIGMAGNLVTSGIEFLTGQTCWNAARRLWNEDHEMPCEQHVQFMRLAGVKGMELEAFIRTPIRKFRHSVAALPDTYTELKESDTIRMGSRNWQVRLGQGHANDHLTFWSDDKRFAFVGDQILPWISPNLTAHYSHPEENLVEQWLQSCARFAQFAYENTLCFPGHNLPFNKADSRCVQMADNCHRMAHRILECLDRPKTIISCLPEIYRRPLEGYERQLLVGELVAYFTWLHNRGSITRRLNSAGQFIWHRTPKQTIDRVEPRQGIL